MPLPGHFSAEIYTPCFIMFNVTVKHLWVGLSLPAERAPLFKTTLVSRSNAAFNDDTRGP
jgi:hypothetical protein